MLAPPDTVDSAFPPAQPSRVAFAYPKSVSHIVRLTVARWRTVLTVGLPSMGLTAVPTAQPSRVAFAYPKGVSRIVRLTVARWRTVRPLTEPG